MYGTIPTHRAIVELGDEIKAAGLSAGDLDLSKPLNQQTQAVKELSRNILDATNELDDHTTIEDNEDLKQKHLVEIYQCLLSILINEYRDNEYGHIENEKGIFLEMFYSGLVNMSSESSLARNIVMRYVARTHDALVDVLEGKW